jgi:hypothetical protein
MPGTRHSGRCLERVYPFINLANTSHGIVNLRWRREKLTK